MSHVTFKFKKEVLKEILWGDNPDYETIKNEIYDTSRWSTWHELIFKEKATGQYFQVTYSRGATECQDEQPWEYDGDEIDCVWVEPVEVTTIDYKPVKP